MADASFDLGVWDAVEAQARAAYTYADLIGHHSLRAWARGTQALLCYWIGSPRRSVDYAQDARRWAPSGPALARVVCIEARAWAHLSAPGQVRACLADADNALEAGNGDDDLFIGVGGQFGWGPGLHSACAGTALLTSGEPAASVVRLREAQAATGSDPFGFLVAERIAVDIANAEVSSGHLDAAFDALAGVWTVPSSYRRPAITGRLDSLAATLTAPAWRPHRMANELRERIDTYNMEARQRRLSLPA